MSLVLDCNFWSFVTRAMCSSLQRCGFADWTGFLCTWIARENPHSISYIFGRICGIFIFWPISFFAVVSQEWCFQTCNDVSWWLPRFWIFWDLFWKTINKSIVTYEGTTMFDAIPVPWCHWLHNALLSRVLVAAALCISFGSFFLPVEIEPTEMSQAT